MLLIGIILVPLFIICLFISLKFIWGEEGKDERGKQITNISYMYSASIFPIGWLLIEAYHGYMNELAFETYRDTIWILVLLTFIVQGLVILNLKKRI
ncbi:hypothetical protein MUN88_00890 [Gracilibacillus caseinilyticus]|uniref:Uncharacterized protein n=1 Tax=Gracilibacillus caseinilyticus TaxID=2932256 RepID=A0ABY4EWV2_9BACI|nr:hypothetical protein [Gracilibacillus caseinilyticus]UOQ48750.1 hypothetical protein MUN88_00890 [Gracilibacillus caseinilyticus]